MDKSAFFKLCPEEEKMQGIGYLLLEMFKIRSHINVLNMQPEIASEFFNQKWNKPLTGYRIIKYMCKIKNVGIKKSSRKYQSFFVKMKQQQYELFNFGTHSVQSCSGSYI